MVPLINLLDLAIVPARLHAAGFSTERATALYGQLTGGMALSLMYFPQRNRDRTGYKPGAGHIGGLYFKKTGLFYITA